MTRPVSHKPRLGKPDRARIGDSNVPPPRKVDVPLVQALSTLALAMVRHHRTYEDVERLAAEAGILPGQATPAQIEALTRQLCDHPSEQVVGRITHAGAWDRRYRRGR